METNTSHIHSHSHEVKSQVQEHAAGPHSGHDSMINDFKKRFIITLFLTVPIMLLSPMIQHWLNLNIHFSGDSYLLMILSTVVFVYGGYPFLSGMITELKSKLPGMMTLIGVAIIVSYVYSVAIVFGLSGMDFFWELSTLILIMLFGHWIEMKSVSGASRELELLVKLMPSEAHMVMKDHVHDVPSDSLKQNDVILVKPGEIIAADGIIIEGNSFINESMLTGESVPVGKNIGNKVIAGSINGNGALHVRVSNSSNESYLSRVIKLVEDAQKSKSKTQLLADKAARMLTIVALVAGFITFAYWKWMANETLVFALERMVTVIVISCPHALGLAVPLVVAISTSLSAKNGLLIKNRTAFENSRKVTTVIFDKTGTLTEGKFQVVKFQSLINEFTNEQILQYASAVENNSEHPIARGVVIKNQELGLEKLKLESFESITGKGAKAIVSGKEVMVVSPGYIQKEFGNIPEESKGKENETVVFVVIDKSLSGFVVLSDKIREESYKAIEELHNHNIKAVLLTGDNSKVAKSVSEQLKMDGYFAEVLPHQKQEKIKELQDKGEFIAMTGDGVNDAPALAQADVGIAVGSGSDIAAETAGIVLVNSNPKDIVNLILFGKATYRKMVQNLVWATGYNVIAIPLAAGILYKYGILLSPAIGAVLMSVSTVAVAINAKLLRVNKS